MATIVEKKPGVFFARVFVAGAPDEPRRQVGRTFRGTKSAQESTTTTDIGRQGITLKGKCVGYRSKPRPFESRTEGAQRLGLQL